MKNYIFIFLLLPVLMGFSQTKENELKDLYSIAIENHIENAKELIEKGISTKKISELYFLVEGIAQDYLPDEINGQKINYLNIYDRKNKAMLKIGINVVSIQPARLEGNKLIIQLIDFRVIYKSKNYDFAKGGASTSLFKYSCDENKWLLEKTKHNGI